MKKLVDVTTIKTCARSVQRIHMMERESPALQDGIDMISTGKMRASDRHNNSELTPVLLGVGHRFYVSRSPHAKLQFITIKQLSKHTSLYLAVPFLLHYHTW